MKTLLAVDLRATDSLEHGLGGAQLQTIQAGQRVRAAELEDRLLSGDESGFPRNSTSWQHAEDCFQWAMLHNAEIKLIGEKEYKSVSIAKLVRVLRPHAGPSTWTRIRPPNGAKTFSTYGYDVRIFAVGEERKGPFAGGGAKLAWVPAAQDLRKQHEEQVREQRRDDPSYRFSKVGGDGHLVYTSPLLDRRDSLTAVGEHFVGVDRKDLATLMAETRRGDRCGIAADADIGCIFTRVLGLNLKPDDVITETPIDELQGLFLRQVMRPPSGKPAFAIILSDEGFKLWKGKMPDAQEDFVPHGFGPFPGRPELLWTGLKARPVDAYGLVRHIFDGEEGCASSKKSVQNAQITASGCASCRYFTAHYDSGAGAAQVLRQIGGGKTK